MLLRGDWLSPSLNGEPFFKKPPLLYWGQIVGYQAFSVGAFGARLGNALAALATLAALYGFFGRPLEARRVAPAPSCSGAASPSCRSRASPSPTSGCCCA